jgi:hypothetical protein
MEHFLVSGIPECSRVITKMEQRGVFLIEKLDKFGEHGFKGQYLEFS